MATVTDSVEGLLAEYGESGATDRQLELRGDNTYDTSGQGASTPSQIVGTTQIYMEGASEPIPQWQLDLINEEARLIGTLDPSGEAGRYTAPSPTALQPLPTGNGGLLPAIAPLPQLDTRPAPLGTTAPNRVGSLAFDEDWEGGGLDLGKVVFDEIINRQQSGVRIGVLPMVVWQKMPRPV